MTIKKFLPIAISIVIMVMGIFFFMMNDKENSAGLATQAAEITKLKNTISVMEAANDTGAHDSKSKTAGLDSARIESGTQAFEDALDILCGWSSTNEYTKMRTAVQGDYDVIATSDLLSKLFPENGKFLTGQTVEDIDNGFRMSVKDATSYVIGITGSEYEYLAQVTFVITNTDKATNEVSGVFTYTVNGTSDVSNVEFIGFN